MAGYRRGTAFAAQTMVKKTEYAVSVVVIGRNEGSRLVRCLNSVRSMHYASDLVELVYVDSGSKDDSVEQATALGAKVFILESGPYTAARARNTGWRHSRGEIVLFLDGDTILDPDFVSKSVTEFADPRIAVVFGNRREIATSNSVYNRVLDYDWIMPYGFTDYCGGDVLIRRAALIDVGGYREDLIAGEEPEMCCRMRQRQHLIFHADRPMTGHDLAMQHWGQYWRRAVRTGYAYAEVSRMLRNSSTPLWIRESKRNFLQGFVYLLLAIVGLSASLWTASIWPLAAVLMFFVALSVRTSLRMASKVVCLQDRLLYALHSHIQQVPIFLGQLGFLWNAQLGRRQQLIEYHRPVR